MGTKKLQVFISSTFTDLRDERQAAVEAVLRAKHIPAGMELFSAGDATQLEVIKEWIEESDAYLLILGARYGSIEPNSGLSYTEVEYDYAVSKGIPYFAVVLTDSAIDTKRSQGVVSASDDSDGARWQRFREKVLCKSSSMVRDARDIMIAVLQSLHEIERRPGLSGWVREGSGDQRALSALSELNDSLKSRIRTLESEIARWEDLRESTRAAELAESVTIRAQRQWKGYSNWESVSTKVTWQELFAFIAMKLLMPMNDETLDYKVAAQLGGFDSESNAKYRVQPDDWETIRAQFLRLGYVKIDWGTTVMKTGALFWSLTPLGKEIGLVLKSVPTKRD